MSSRSTRTSPRKRAASAPRQPLARERVLQTALRLADDAGIEALSMRRLAQALGVEAMSLYNHVANKVDLLDGMVEQVMAEIELPAIGGDWRDGLRERTLSAHEVLLRHRWAPLLFVARLNVGPAMLRYVDATHGCLLAAGFTHAEDDHARNVIDSHLYGFTLQELLFPLAPGSYAEAARHFLPMVPAERYPHMRALTEEVIEGRHDGLHDFAFGLELLLEGLETLRLAPATPKARRPRKR